MCTCLPDEAVHCSSPAHKSADQCQIIQAVSSSCPGFALVGVDWDNPQQLVLGQFVRNTGQLNMERLGSAHQMNAALRKAPDLIRLLVKLVSHETRRGAAVDVAHVDKRPSAEYLDLHLAQNVLGHSDHFAGDGRDLEVCRPRGAFRPLSSANEQGRAAC